MIKRFFWVGVGLMLTGILTTTIALSQSNDADPALVPTLTETPTLVVEVVQPTLEAPTIVVPTLEPPTVDPALLATATTDPALLPPPTIDPALLPTSTVDPAILPTTDPAVVQPEITVDPGLPTTDPVLLPSATLDPAIMPTSTIDPALVPTNEPVFVEPEVTVDPALPTFDPALLSTAVPARPTPQSGSSLSGGVSAPVMPTVDGTLQVTPIDVNVPNTTAVPTEQATLAPIDLVQTAVATQTTIVEATVVAATTVPGATVMPTQAATAVTEGTGQIAGVVTFEHLQQHAGIRLTLQLPDGSITNLASDDQGRFAFANLVPGSYTLQASSHGFMTIHVEFTLTEGQQINVPAGLLKRGDTNEDNLVDLRDVALIAANFNGPAEVSETDLNGDGWVDISDLSLAGALFGTSGPLNWS